MATTIASSTSSLAVSIHEQKNPLSASVQLNKNGSFGCYSLAQQKPFTAVDAPSVPPLTDGIRVVKLAEYKQAAACLAEAFAGDDVVWYPIDTPDRAHWSKEEKWALHVEILEYVTYAHILKGLVTTIGDFDAIALWMPPGQNMDDTLTHFRSGMWRLNYRLSPEGKRRFFNEFLPLLHDTKHATLGSRDDTSWYLVYIGTKPSAQGKGYGRKLIEHVTRQADQEGRATYLESSNDVNPGIYRRFGFETVRRVWLQRGVSEVGLDVMVREPVSAASEALREK